MHPLTVTLVVLTLASGVQSVPQSRIFDPTQSFVNGLHSQLRITSATAASSRSCKDANSELIELIKRLKDRYSQKLTGLKSFVGQLVVDEKFVDPTAPIDASGVCNDPMFTDSGTGNFNFDINFDDYAVEEQKPCVVSQWSEWEGPYGFGMIGRKRTILEQGCGCPPPSDLVQIIELMPFISAFQNTTSVGGFIQNCFLAGNCREDKSQPRDVLVVLDSSGSIKPEAFEFMLKGLRLMIDLFCGSFGPGDGNNRLAIFQYASRDEMRVVHSFSDNQDPEYLKQVVANIKHFAGNTCTGTALARAADEIFTSAQGMRDFTAKDTLLITDGQYNCGLDLLSGADRLKQVSTLFALGIGIAHNPTARAEVESVVTEKNSAHIFSLDRFQDFFEMVEDLETKIRNNCVPIVDV